MLASTTFRRGGRLRLWVAAAALCGGLTLTATQTSAQAPSQVTPDIKGMVGLGLVGAELGFVIPAAAGATDAWAYVVFPILGAGGGAAGGYLLFDSGGGSAELAVASLTFGMAMMIPTIVFTLSATAYDPDDDEDVSTEPPPTDGKVSVQVGDSRKARRGGLALGGPGLLKLSEERLIVGAPAVTVAMNLSATEALRTGTERRAEYRVSLLSGSF